MVNLRTSLSQLRRTIATPASSARWPASASSHSPKVRVAPAFVDGPPPGLHTYRIDLNGGQRRVHLRVDPDGSGVLFRDVTDVIHLNQTAPASRIWRWKACRRSAPAARCSAPSAAARSLTPTWPASTTLVAAMTDPGYDCPTCALPELPRADLFSTPVHAPYKVDLAITYGCNNECPHCYNEPSHYPMASLSKEHWFEVIDRLHALGVPHLIFTGGEATLHPDLRGDHRPRRHGWATSSG